MGGGLQCADVGPRGCGRSPARQEAHGGAFPVAGGACREWGRARGGEGAGFGGGGYRKMAYNMYQTQLSQAWAERVNKESAQQEMFWKNRAKKLRDDDLQSVVTRASAKTTTT